MNGFIKYSHKRSTEYFHILLGTS